MVIVCCTFRVQCLDCPNGVQARKSKTILNPSRLFQSTLARESRTPTVASASIGTVTEPTATAAKARGPGSGRRETEAPRALHMLARASAFQGTPARGTPARGTRIPGRHEARLLLWRAFSCAFSSCRRILVPPCQGTDFRRSGGAPSPDRQKSASVPRGRARCSRSAAGSGALCAACASGGATAPAVYPPARRRPDRSAPAGVRTALAPPRANRSRDKADARHAAPPGRAVTRRCSLSRATLPSRARGAALSLARGAARYPTEAKGPLPAASRHVRRRVSRGPLRKRRSPFF